MQMSEPVHDEKNDLSNQLRLGSSWASEQADEASLGARHFLGFAVLWLT